MVQAEDLLRDQDVEEPPEVGIGSVRSLSACADSGTAEGVPGEMPSLVEINARRNYVAELDLEAMVAGLCSLESLNLEENPVNKNTYEELERLTKVRVLLSPRNTEEWEDLSI